jgi:hypothetical protein
MNKKLFVLEQNKGINFIMCKFNKHLQPNGLYYAFLQPKARAWLLLFFATKNQSLALLYSKERN